MSTGGTNEAHDAQTKHLRPTLLIGLGGSGKDVLLRIRRLFYERHGARNRQLGPPIIGYLVLDTDHGAFTRIEGEKLSHFVLQNIEFEPADMVGCQLQANEFNEYFNGGEHIYPHIFRWMDAGMRKYGSGAITSGAGQNRPFGRLAFFHHYAEIRQRLEAKLNGIVDHARDPGLRRQWLPDDARVDDSQLEIVLIYSLAGGTGAGMFMDMGLLARKVVSDLLPSTGVHFTHFAMLPEAFVQAPRPEIVTVVDHPKLQRKIQENAFGALREMEYFAMRQDPARFDLSIPPPAADNGEAHAERRALYSVQWDQNAEPYKVDDCPWDTCYLVGGRNDHMGQKCLKLGDLYQMIAEHIFLDFEPSPFGNEKRSLRPNLKEQTLDYMKDPVKDDKSSAVLYYRHMSKRYSTFGLSQIYFDRERMRRAASYRLAGMLIRKQWLRDPLGPAEINQIAKEDLLGGGSKNDQAVTDTHVPGDPRHALSFREICRSTLVVEDGSEKTYWDRVGAEAVELEQEVKQGKYDPYSPRPFTEWTDKHEALLKGTRASTGDTGLAVRSMGDRAKKLQKALDARARCMFIFRLQTLGIRPCLQLFKEYAAVCEKQFAELQQGEQNKEPRPPAKWRQQVEDSRRRLAEAESLWIPLYARRAALWEKQRAREQLRRAVAGFRDYLYDLYTYRALSDIRASLERCRRRFSTATQEGSYLGVLQRFYDSLGDTKEGVREGVLGYLDDRFDELKSRPIDEASRTIGLLAQWDAREYDRAIGRLLTTGASDERIDWADVERQVLEQWRGLKNLPKSWKEAKSLSDLVLLLCPLDSTETLVKSKREEFAQWLAEACEGLLGGFATELTALKQFEKEKAEERRHTLYQFRTYSAPYLRKNQGVESHKIVDTSLRICLGMANKDGATADEAKEFRDDLRESAKLSPLKLVELNDKTFEMKDDAIVLYQEKAGIPICYEASLDALGDLYDTSDRIAETHMDYRGMREVLPEIRLVDSVRQKRLAKCFEDTIYAYILGILRRSPERREFRLALEQEGGGELYQGVGTRLEEVAHICAGRHNERLRKAVQSRVEHWIDDATHNNPERLVLLWCALQWAYEEILHRVQVLLDAQTRMPTAQKGQGELGAHPLVYILGSNMLPFIKEKVSQIDPDRRWRNHEFDLYSLLKSGGESKHADIRQQWKDRVRPCFDIAPDLPIPVIRSTAKLPTSRSAADEAPAG